MRRYAGAWRFGAEQVADDGVRFNFQFDAYPDALPAWRDPDMTDHVDDQAPAGARWSSMALSAAATIWSML